MKPLHTVITAEDGCYSWIWLGITQRPVHMKVSVMGVAILKKEDPQSIS